VRKPEGERPLGRSRRRWVDNINVNFKEINLGGVDWIDLAQDKCQWRAFVYTIMKLQVPKNTGKFLSNCMTGSSPWS
jgi:hypothetical protein